MLPHFSSTHRRLNMSSSFQNFATWALWAVAPDRYLVFSFVLCKHIDRTEVQIKTFSNYSCSHGNLSVLLNIHIQILSTDLTLSNLHSPHRNMSPTIVSLSTYSKQHLITKKFSFLKYCLQGRIQGSLFSLDLDAGPQKTGRESGLLLPHKLSRLYGQRHS